MIETNIENFRAFINQVMEGEAELVIPIEDDEGTMIGELVPITKLDLDDYDILTSLTNWRNTNKEMFLTQFEATPERTKIYLEKITRRNSSQTLFKVMENGRLVGQVGWKDLNVESAIIDNGMKGEKSENPKILIFAHKSLISWLLKNSVLRELTGWLFADNIPGIMMNRQIGWTDWIKYPMSLNKVDNNVEWLIGKAGEESPDNKYCYRLVMRQ